MEIEDVGYEIQKHIDKKYKNLTEYCKHEDIGYKKFAEKLKRIKAKTIPYVIYWKILSSGKLKFLLSIIIT